MQDTFKINELYNLIADLFEKTNILHESLISNTDKQNLMYYVQLSEIFTISENIKLYLSINEELNHYELSSLIQFWGETYFQMKLVIKDNDSNTSWLSSRFNNYKGQNEIVLHMLKTTMN